MTYQIQAKCNKIIPTFILALFLCLGATNAVAQVLDKPFCPVGHDLYSKASAAGEAQTYDERSAFATLLWLERGDAIWLITDKTENSELSMASFRIRNSYEYESAGYPKDMKVGERFKKYRQDHIRHKRSKNENLTRPKNVPAGPPESAIKFAEQTLGCQYAPEIAREHARNLRAETLPLRQMCPFTEADLSEHLNTRGPDWFIPLEQDSRNGYVSGEYNRAAMEVLNWKLKGLDAFQSPDEDGQDRTQQRRGTIAYIAYRGYSGVIAPNPELFAAISNFSENKDKAVLSKPDDAMLEWAEDRLFCRYDGDLGHQQMANDAAQKEQERLAWIANAPQREAQSEADRQEALIRQEQIESDLIAFANENPNCQAEYEKIYFVMTGRPLQNAKTCSYGCNPGFEKATDAQVSFAMSCQKAQRKGLVATPDDNVVQSSPNDGVAPYTLSDGLRDMGNAAACTRQERKCVSDGQYERCRMVTVKIC